MNLGCQSHPRPPPPIPAPNAHTYINGSWKSELLMEDFYFDSNQIVTDLGVETKVTKVTVSFKRRDTRALELKGLC